MLFVLVGAEVPVTKTPLWSIWPSWNEAVPDAAVVTLAVMEQLMTAGKVTPILKPQVCIPVCQGMSNLKL